MSFNDREQLIEPQFWDLLAEELTETQIWVMQADTDGGQHNKSQVFRSTSEGKWNL